MNFEGITSEYVLYGYLFALTNRIQTLGDKAFGEVTIKQHFLLISLGVFEEAPSLKELACFMGCSYQNVKRMAVALEQKGFLKIKPDETDHRKTKLHLTEKVNKLGAEHEKVIADFMKEMYCGIDKEDIAITAKTIQKMNGNLGGRLE